MATEKEDSGAEELGVEVRVIGEPKGKGLFATKHFKKGDILFQERPLVCCQFAWNASYGYLACGYCMRPLEGAEENVRRLSTKNDVVLPHPECCPTKKDTHTECSVCKMKYCSTACKEQAWEQYHQLLCFIPGSSHPLDIMNETWKQMHYPPETASIMLLAQMVATVRQAKDKEGALSLFMQFCHRTVNDEEEIAHKLLGDEFKEQLETLRGMFTTALYDPSCEQWFTEEGFRSLFALVGTNSQGVGTSPLSEWVKNTGMLDISEEERDNLDTFIDELYTNLDDECGGFLNNEGSALYTLQSACNHSCTPNAQPTFPYSNFELAMCALEDIAPGEEICVSYLEECVLDRSRHTRHRILREHYLFTCYCSKCEAQADDPDLTSDVDEEEEEEEEDDDDDDEEEDEDEEEEEEELEEMSKQVNCKHESD